ncbi:MAG: CBS domain-containing protein [Candidatus Eisenbacteria bacterium]|nr:CBS domain-containing protein [Candidatus Eisenbacteria bacterium]
MHRGFEVGRLFGIRIRIDWSWLIIFTLITWSLGASFSEMHPGWSTATAWSVALVAAFLFFGSVLAHELAHSLFARSRGVPVRVITLFLFGGVSNIERDPDTPRSEFIMAILGPLTSLVIGGVLLLLASLMAASSPGSLEDPVAFVEGLSPVTTVLIWLGSVNVFLAVFNMVPGFPLDGGRVLRSALWAATGDLVRATRYASFVGQGVAWLLILMGIAMVFGIRVPIFGSGFGGLWLAFIGWFLHNAATRSYQQIVVRDILEGVLVKRMAISNPPTVSPDATVEALVHDHIMQTDDHAFPVMDGEAFVGLVTLGDVRSVDRSEWPSKRVREIMTPSNELDSVTPDTDAATALMKLVGKDVRQLPVVDDGSLVGLLRRRDLMRWLQFHSDRGLHEGMTRSGQGGR